MTGGAALFLPTYSFVDVRAWELFDPAIAPNGEDLRPFLREALARGARWFEASSASAFLAENPGEYVLAAQFGGIPLPVGTTLRAGVAQAAIEAREPLLVGDPADHPRLKAANVARRTDVASAMILPLILPDGEAVGVINLARDGSLDPYGPDDLLQARHMAGHFAMAVGLAIRTADAAKMARKEAQSRHLAEIGRMTAVLAHEIRNPLSVIRAAAQFATEAPEYLETVIEESDRLEALLEGFLDFSKPVHVNLRQVDLTQLLESLASREEASFRVSNVHLNLQTKPGDPVLVDPRQVEQACRNLLQNAKEATGPGGNVTLTVWRNGFEVSDDGPGLAPAIREQLFTPFVTAKPRGTGLGLTVVQRVAEAHGGRVVVGGEEGKGASFRVELGVAA